MPVPNHQDDVARVAARYPDAWRHAHTGGPRTEEFIRLLAAHLHALNPRFGLNGKRGNPNDISDDAVNYKGEGDQFDPTNGNSPVSVIDVIGAAGSDNPQPQWLTFPGNVHAGAWVEPEELLPGGGPVTPTPQPQPEPQPDIIGQLDLIRSGITFVINQLAAQRNDIINLHNQLGTANERIASLKDTAKDIRATQDRPLAVEIGHRILGNMRGVVKP